jgi:hypothetical protein
MKIYNKGIMERWIFSLIALLFILIGCSRRDEHPVPYVPIQIYLHGSDPEFMPLNAVGGSIHFWGGSRGLIIYRKSQDEFNVFDRHCPYDVENPCGVVSIEKPGSFIATDTCCGSKFLLIDGSVNEGPARIPLRGYFSQWDGVRLMITN